MGLPSWQAKPLGVIFCPLEGLELGLQLSYCAKKSCLSFLKFLDSLKSLKYLGSLKFQISLTLERVKAKVKMARVKIVERTKTKEKMFTVKGKTRERTREKEKVSSVCPSNMIKHGHRGYWPNFRQ